MFEVTSYPCGLGELSDSKKAQGTAIGTGVAASAIGGPIGLAVGTIGGILAKIFGAHGAKVQAENQATQNWAASGPSGIESIMGAWRAGSLSSSEAISSLQSIEEQYKSGMASVSKYHGKFGVFPDPESARPSKDCNAACGMYWDLHQQIKGLIAEIQGSGGGGLSFGSLSFGSLPIPLLVIGGLILFKVIKI